MRKIFRKPRPVAALQSAARCLGVRRFIAARFIWTPTPQHGVFGFLGLRFTLVRERSRHGLLMKTPQFGTALFVAGTAALLLHASPARGPENLIQNPGFETGSGEAPEGWMPVVPAHSNRHEMMIDNSERHSGRQSYRMSGMWTYPRRPASLRTAAPVPLDPGRKYLLGFWYKTRDIHEYSIPLAIQFVVSGDNIPPVTYEKRTHNVADWSQYFILLDHIPAGASRLDLVFQYRPNSKGSILIDDISLTEATPEEVARFEQWRRQPVPKPAGNGAGRSFAATGFFRVEKAEDRWWIVDPNGNPTWAIATDGRGPVVGAENLPTQTESFRREFGSTSAEANERIYALFQELGFNAFTGWTADEFAKLSGGRHDAGRPYLFMSKVLNLSLACDDPAALARDRSGNLLNKGNHWVVDPFNPKWRGKAREKAEAMIAPYRGKPWFFGWYVDNEIDYGELFRYIWADHSGREFVGGLKRKYGTIDALNRAWSAGSRRAEYPDFDAILAAMPEPADWDDPAWPDFAAFERRMIKEYIDYTYETVKGLDPDHLVISNRLNLGPMPELHRTIDLWGRYDVVCINIYPDNNQIGFNAGELELMRTLYERTGRPVIIGEWGIPAIDSGLYAFGEDPLGRSLDWSWPQVLRTQKERGEAYAMCLSQLASLEFMIGSGWYRTFDVDTPERRANRGIFNGKFELYRDLTDAMRKAHAGIVAEMGIGAGGRAK